MNDAGLGPEGGLGPWIPATHSTPRSRSGACSTCFSQSRTVLSAASALASLGCEPHVAPALGWLECLPHAAWVQDWTSQARVLDWPQRALDPAYGGPTDPCPQHARSSIHSVQYGTASHATPAPDKLTAQIDYVWLSPGLTEAGAMGAGSIMRVRGSQTVSTGHCMQHISQALHAEPVQSKPYLLCGSI